jgi:hypothetical protein
MGRFRKAVVDRIAYLAKDRDEAIKANDVNQYADDIRADERDILMLAGILADCPSSRGIRCDFCGKSRDHVRYLVESMYGVRICDECAAEAMDMIGASE